MIIRVFFCSKKKFLKHLLLELFYWGRREKSSWKSCSICSLSTFVLKKKSPFHLFYKCPFFLFLFRFALFSFLLFSFLLCLPFSKKKDRIKWEMAWCNGCPANQINDNGSNTDFTRSTTSPHAAVIRRAFNRAKRSSTLEQILGNQKQCFFFFQILWKKCFRNIFPFLLIKSV